MHQSLQGATFHVEHIVPRSRGGSTQLANLAWACPGCNLHKSDRVAVIDVNGQPVRMFDPRMDRWDEHFRWDRYVLLPLTPVGAGTIEALHLNAPRRIQIRRAEELFGLFPP